MVKSTRLTKASKGTEQVLGIDKAERGPGPFSWAAQKRLSPLLRRRPYRDRCHRPGPGLTRKGAAASRAQGGSPELMPARPPTAGTASGKLRSPAAAPVPETPSWCDAIRLGSPQFRRVWGLRVRDPGTTCAVPGAARASPSRSGHLLLWTGPGSRPWSPTPWSPPPPTQVYSTGGGGSATAGSRPRCRSAPCRPDPALRHSPSRAVPSRATAQCLLPPGGHPAPCVPPGSARRLRHAPRRASFGPITDCGLLPESSGRPPNPSTMRPQAASCPVRPPDLERKFASVPICVRLCRPQGLFNQAAHPAVPSAAFSWRLMQITEMSLENCN